MSAPEAAAAVHQAAAPDPHAHIEADDDSLEVDSALGGSDTESDTTSLASSVLNYKYENGRRYHSYREGKYVLPNDEQEQERQDILHHVRVLALDGKLFRAPITSSPQRVLDLGTGTGIWAIDFADEFSSAQVTGTDLSPIQPSWIPPNLSFIVDDMEADWLPDWNEQFDFIHARDLGGSVSDWAKLYEQAYRALKPGGWLEMQEFEVWIRSDDDTLKKAPSLIKLQELIDEASTKLGKQMNVAEQQKGKMSSAGFENVTDDVYKIPISQWPKDRKLRQLGLYTGETFMAACESYSLALLTRILGWTVAEVQVLIANTRKELKNKGVHAYGNMHFIYGRKPTVQAGGS